jgi:putative transcriptional regulator
MKSNARRALGSVLAVMAVLASRPVSVPARQPPPLAGPHNRGEVRALAKGKVLVASRALVDPNFVETVILLVEFTNKGAVGLVLNRQTDIPLSRLFTGPEGLHTAGARLFQGGPVEINGILGLVRASTSIADRHIVRDIYLVNSRESLENLAASGASPERYRVYAGYSGWGSEQLQRETMTGAWSVIDGDSKIVFDRTPDTLWDRLLKRTGGVQARTEEPSAGFGPAAAGGARGRALMLGPLAGRRPPRPPMREPTGSPRTRP